MNQDDAKVVSERRLSRVSLTFDYHRVSAGRRVSTGGEIGAHRIAVARGACLRPAGTRGRTPHQPLWSVHLADRAGDDLQSVVGVPESDRGKVHPPAGQVAAGGSRRRRWEPAGERGPRHRQLGREQFRRPWGLMEFRHRDADRGARSARRPQEPRACAGSWASQTRRSCMSGTVAQA